MAPLSPCTAPPSRGPATEPDPPAKADGKPWVIPTRGEWTRDASGERSDPVNIYVHGNLKTIESDFEKAGWVQANPPTCLAKAGLVGAVIVEGCERLINAIWAGLLWTFDFLTLRSFQALPIPLITDGAIKAMPVSEQTLNGRPMLAAYERDTYVFGGRHHFRIFATGRLDQAGQPVFAIAATRDVGIKIDVHRPEQLFLNHFVEKDTDLERDFVLSALRSGHPRMSQLSLQYGAAPASGATSLDGRASEVVFPR